MKIDKKFKGLVKEDYRYVFNGDIKTTESLEIDLGMRLFVSGCIEVGGSIEAGWSIEAGEFIKAGGYYGIVAGLSITCKDTLSFGLKVFAGICAWREVTDEEKTITCGKLENGAVGYGILKETGLEPEDDDRTEEAMKLLREKGYKIVKNLN